MNDDSKMHDAGADADAAGLDDEDMSGCSKTVTLVSSKDDQRFTLLTDYTDISVLVKTALSSDEAATEVPIPGMNGPTLERVVEYMNHHKGVEAPLVEKPLRSKDMKVVCKDVWDAEYIDRVGENHKDLYDLILAANYLDIRGLLHLGAAKVGSLVKNEPVGNINAILEETA